uniref:LysR substrate-binding domain-containing protein n=1 Tax=Acidocella sp. TaxID=50710 RepID=UPI003FD7D948
TEAGAFLLDDARRILDLVEQAKAGVESRARGETGVIHVGFAGATLSQPLILNIIQAYRARYPGVILSPEQSNTPRLAAGLSSREIDVAFVRPPVSNMDELAVEPLVEEPMVIVLPASHPHAGDRAIPIVALAEETFILLPRAIGVILHDAVIDLCRAAGFNPKLGQEAPQIPAIVHMVAAGFGVSIVPQSIKQTRAEGVAFVPIEGEVPMAPIWLAYRRNERSTTVRSFVAIARQIAHSAVASDGKSGVG